MATPYRELFPEGTLLGYTPLHRLEVEAWFYTHELSEQRDIAVKRGDGGLCSRRHAYDVDGSELAEPNRLQIREQALHGPGLKAAWAKSNRPDSGFCESSKRAGCNDIGLGLFEGGLVVNAEAVL